MSSMENIRGKDSDMDDDWDFGRSNIYENYDLDDDTRVIHVPFSQSKEKEDVDEKELMGNRKDSIEYGYEISFQLIGD